MCAHYLQRDQYTCVTCANNYSGPGGHSMCHVTSDDNYVLKADYYVLIECEYELFSGVYVPRAINYVPCDK